MNVLCVRACVGTRGLQVYYHGDWNNAYGGFAEYAIGTVATMRLIPDGMSYEGEQLSQCAFALPAACCFCCDLLGH